MKVLLLAAIVELDDNDTETHSAPVPRPTSPSSLNELLRRLIREAREGRNPDFWKEEQYGPILQI